MKQHWDIFCRVIDNYGDIAVCWRLAKTLTHDHGMDVRLWVDDLITLKALLPDTDPKASQQIQQEITLIHWTESLSSSIEPAGIVIEAFGCDLPDFYLKKMQNVRPVWINLDYLSAEPWVKEFHGMPSTQANGLEKYFFYPSIHKGTGGLMREANLLEQQKTYQNQANKQAWLSNLGLKPSSDGRFKISLFGYANAGLDKLLAIWSKSQNPIDLYLAPGPLHQQATQYLEKTLKVGQSLESEAITFHSLPFLPQSEYDKLLWHCDLNFVRGEESFVRAQWAAKPFIWHSYPTKDLAHWQKLDAFFKRYVEGLDAELAQTIIHFNQAWNQAHHQTLDQQAWLAVIKQISAWQQHSQNWVKHLNQLGDLTSNLVKFVKSKV